MQLGDTVHRRRPRNDIWATPPGKVKRLASTPALLPTVLILNVNSSIRIPGSPMSVDVEMDVYVHVLMVPKALSSRYHLLLPTCSLWCLPYHGLRASRRCSRSSVTMRNEEDDWGRLPQVTLNSTAARTRHAGPLGRFNHHTSENSDCKKSPPTQALLSTR